MFAVLVGCAASREGTGLEPAAVDSSPQDGDSPPLDAVADDGGEPARTADARPSATTACGPEGTLLHVASDVDVCLPKTVCTAETCPPPLGRCVDGVCQFRGEYKGLATLPEAWATYYCTLSTGGCHGVTQLAFPEDNAAAISKRLGLPLCEGASGSGPCVGIAASSPTVVGNSQQAIDPKTGAPVAKWGLGLTEASGVCYEVTGPGGTAIVALTDRCGGYCRCKGSGFMECGPCVSAPDMEPNCACVGSAPGVSAACCGRGCAEEKADCDWCASNNHPHFDLDTGAFNHVCGADSKNGSCRIHRVRPSSCLPPNPAWPPGAASCKAGSFQCDDGPSPHHAQVPGTKCCCNWDLTPKPDGSCG